MGCFSFLCQKCGKGIKSNSFNGERVHLFLLKNSKVIEQMEGPYDSYGRVFNKEMKSMRWLTPWSAVCDLMFEGSNRSGIAAIHTRCFDGVIPTEQSEHDPMQGWGESGELMSNVDADLQFD